MSQTKKANVVGLAAAIKDLCLQTKWSTAYTAAKCQISTGTFNRWVDENDYARIVHGQRTYRAIRVQRRVLKRFTNVYYEVMGRLPAIKTFPC